MSWQEIVVGSIVAGAALYVLWRLRGAREEPRSSGTPDVPVSRLTKKRSKNGSCRH